MQGLPKDPYRDAMNVQDGDFRRPESQLASGFGGNELVPGKLWQIISA